MFKKLNPLVLFGILILLAIALVVITRMDTRKQQGSFVRELTHADLHKTTRIEIIHHGIMEDAIVLEKREPNWFLIAKGKEYRANVGLVYELLESFSPLFTEQLVSRDPQSWPQYEVDKESGIRLKMYQGNRLTTDIVVGTYQFQQQIVQGQQMPKISTYVRLTGQDDVYSVSGFLSWLLSSDPDRYRHQTVISANTSEIEEVVMSGSGDHNFRIYTEGGLWFIDGQFADPAFTENYLMLISSLTSNIFVDEEAEGWLNIPSHQLYIRRKADVPIEIKAYPADTTHRYFITSSQNPGAVFSGVQNDLFETLFIAKNQFLAVNE